MLNITLGVFLMLLVIFIALQIRSIIEGAREQRRRPHLDPFIAVRMDDDEA